MAEVAFLAAAQDEYADAYLWYGRQSQQVAGRFRGAMNRLLEDIGRMPEMYALKDVARREALVPGFPYAVLYRVEADGSVLVVAVAHTARRPGYRRGRG